MSGFRAINESDYPAVVRIVREAFVEPARRFGITTDNCPVHPSHYSHERLLRDMSIGRRFYVLERSGTVVGCVCLREGNADAIPELSRLAVDPTQQHHGVGTELVERAVTLAQSSGATAIKLFLFAQHAPLVSWYEKRGFRITDTFEVNDVPIPVSSMIRTISGVEPAYVRILKPVDQPILEHFLMGVLDSSAMLLSNLRHGGMVDHGAPRQATYMGAFRDGDLVGVGALCWNGVILPQAPDMLDPLVRTLAAIRPRPIQGAVGLERQVARTAQVLSLPTGRQPAVMMDSHEILYRLDIADMKMPDELARGRYRCRRVTARDVPVLADWMIDFNLESLNRRLSRDEVVAGLTNMAEERDNRWVLEGDDGLLSTTGFNAATPEVVQVGGVYSPPEHRGRHYARCAVAGSLLEARAMGVPRCVLFTAQSNEPAQKAYEALGFRRIDDFRLLLLKQDVEPRLVTPAF